MTQSNGPTVSRGRLGGRRSPAEWTTLSIVFLVIAALVAVLVWRALTTADDVVLTVTIDQAAIERRGKAFEVPLTVRNEGQAPAEEVLVHVAVRRMDETVEETELTFSFLGGGETANGVALFADDPRSNTLEAHVSSFLVP